MNILTIVSFLFFTSLVGFLTWVCVRKKSGTSSDEYFLAGRSLTFPFIAGSLLLTNLSTEQLVGLNGAAFQDGFCVMVWEVGAVVSLVLMALFFLPRFLKSGVTTVPEYLTIRFDETTGAICNAIFLTGYIVILLPMILYTGATGMIGILDITSLPGLGDSSTALVVIVWVVGVIGSIYALFGGLRSVAVSDTLNGIGLLVGGFLIAYFGFAALGGEDGFIAGWNRLYSEQSAMFNSIGRAKSSVPFGAVFSGIFLIQLFYWSSNQQIIQRTFGASSLAEGQKGIMLTGVLKLLAPIYLVFPGMIAVILFQGEGIKGDQAFGMLAQRVLPGWATGFFAAAMLGAVLSSFNSALNSVCTLFSVGIYKPFLNPQASEVTQIRSSQIFGVLVAVAAMVIAPFLASTGSIFAFLQKMNGIYSIPILSVVLLGMLSGRMTRRAAKFGLIVGPSLIACCYFIYPLQAIVNSLHEFHFLGVVFGWLIMSMLMISTLWPDQEWEQVDVQAVDLTPWRWAPHCGVLLLIGVISIFLIFADFSVLE